MNSRNVSASGRPRDVEGPARNTAAGRVASDRVSIDRVTSGSASAGRTAANRVAVGSSAGTRTSGGSREDVLTRESRVSGLTREREETVRSGSGRSGRYAGGSNADGRRRSAAKSAAYPVNPFQFSPRMFSILNIGMLVLVALDLIGLGLIADGRMLQLALILLRTSGLEGVELLGYSAGEVHMLLSLFIAFLLGGIVVNLLMRAAAGLAKEAGLSVQRRHFTWILVALCAICLIVTLISIWTGHPYTSFGTFRWLTMLLTGLGGLLLYGLSALQVEV